MLLPTRAVTLKLTSKKNFKNYDFYSLLIITPAPTVDPDRTHTI